VYSERVKLFILNNLCRVSTRVELSTSSWTFHSIIVESRTVQIVFSSVLNSVEDTLVECQLNTVEIIQVFCSSFHLWCSVIMEASADIELYEEIVGNPAYSSSSDTSKSDPVSSQFKEPRQTECREEYFFARARSRPDPRIISHALAGKNIQEPRSCDTFVECWTYRMELYDNSIHYWGRDVQTLPHLTSLRYWRPKAGHELVNVCLLTLTEGWDLKAVKLLSHFSRLRTMVNLLPW